MRGSSRRFFSSRWVDAPADAEELDPAQLAPGFRAAGAACGLKGGGQTDVGLLACGAEKVASAVLLTRNAAAAAPVRVCRDRVKSGSIRGAVVNSGNANAATGEQGLRDAIAMQEAAARELETKPEEVAVAETGTIGVPLDVNAVLEGVTAAAAELSPAGGEDFGRAIMTTDRGPKQCTVSCDGVTVSAQAKGAGMIEPGFATMLCFVQTDARIGSPKRELSSAVDRSFERITVDGQMSTNDTVLLQATGEAGRPLPSGLLEAILLQLALEIVADGEGATRTCRVVVEEAGGPAEAERVARAIANSQLVQTALFGRDSNWGRIAQAAGMALAGKELPELGPDRIRADELAGARTEAEIGVRLGRGKASTHVYFSDLNYDYIRINAEYTT